MVDNFKLNPTLRLIGKRLQKCRTLPREPAVDLDELLRRLEEAEVQMHQEAKHQATLTDRSST